MPTSVIGEHLGLEPVAGRAATVLRQAGRLDAISQGKTLTATGPSTLSVLTTEPPPSSATSVSPSGPASAFPVRTTAPVKSATKPMRGVAASSPGVPSWTTRPASITPTRSPSSAASVKSWVTSRAGTPGLAQHGAELTRGASRACARRAPRAARRAAARRARARAPARAPRAGARRRRACAGRASASALHPEAREQLERALAALAARQPAQRVGHVVPGAQVREERVLLEQVAAAAPLGRDESRPVAVSSQVSLAEATTAALGTQEARDHAQDARLAGARTGRPAPGTRRPPRRAPRRARARRAGCAPQRAAPPSASEPATSFTDSRIAAGHGHQHGRERQRRVEVGARNGRRWQAGRSG